MEFAADDAAYEIEDSEQFKCLLCSSLVEEDKLDLARALEAKAAATGVKLILPTDVVLADKFAPDANTKVGGVTSSYSFSMYI